MSAAQAKEAIKSENSTVAVRQLRDKKEVRFNTNPNGSQAAGQSRLVFVISSAVVSHKTGAAQAFRMPVDIHYAGRSGAASLWFPIPIVPSLFVFDKCHSIKDGATEFWKQVDDIHRLSSSEHHRTQYRFSKVQSSAGHRTDSLALTAAFTADLTQFLKPIVIARTDGSPILDQTVAGSRQDYTKVIKTVSVPLGLAGDLEELGKICREGLSKRGIRPKQGLNILAKVPVFTQYFCAAIIPAIASAQLTISRLSSAYPSRAVDVDEDIEKGDRGLIYQSAHLHQGHDWLREVTRILLIAYGDRGSGSKERQKHVLVIAATPSLTGHLAVILRSYRKLLGKVVVHCVSSKSVETYVIISTANLVGTGTDALTFCNYLIIFGELFIPYYEG
ncbi:hypothetical protein J3E69DRAFT_367262 [Trichoderma sp. SZMC 28015]